MNRVEMIDCAKAEAADVFTQWSGVEIDWSDVGTVRAELDAHWAHEPIEQRTEDWTGHDEEAYRNLVARELLRMRAAY